MTTEVYLGNLAHNKGYEAVRWCAEKFGPGTYPDPANPEGTRRWYLRELAYVVFENDRDATYFILQWSS